MKSIYLLSGNIVRLINAHFNGFCVIPIVNTPSSNLVELHLVEKYLVNARLYSNDKAENASDFEFLF